jgi:hypothetical protein
MGARRVNKNPVLWGIIGGLVYFVPVLILFPIINDIIQSSKNPGSVIWSYIAILIAIGLGASIIVYKKVLLNTSTSKKSPGIDKQA